MATTAMTIQKQVTGLQADIKSSLEKFFASLPDMENFVSMANSLTEQAKSIVVFRRNNLGVIEVSDQDAYVKAVNLVQALKTVSDEINDSFDPFIKKLHQAHRTATSIRKMYLDPIQSEMDRLKCEREQFYVEEERKRQESAMKAQEEARKAEEERLLAEAQQAASEGDSAAAAAFYAEAANVEAPPVVLQSTVPQVEGASFRSKWEYTLVDKTKLKPEFLIPDEKAIQANVNHSHKAAEQIVGVGAIKVYERKISVNR